MTGIASMTGFARIEGKNDDASWAWEIRSVNGRSLDIRVRAPGFVDQAERKLRQAATARFKRGSIQANLTVERADAPTVGRIDQQALAALLADLAKVELPDGAQVAPASLDGLLQVRGVLVADDPTAADESYRTAPLADLPALLDGLAAARLEEGARLAAVLAEILDNIASLAARAKTLADRQPQALAARYRETILRLIDDAAPAPEERIVQEAAALAVKADVTEELDRLAAHVAQARELIEEGGAIGRRLDFLAQEFNREANTLGAKSADLELTRVSMDLKAQIDALREQAQNVE